MIPKREAKRDKAVLAAVKGTPCIICRRPSDPAHVRSRGAGGPDETWNLIPLCRSDHRLQHAMGWHRFAQASDSVMQWLRQNGWEFRGMKPWNAKLSPDLEKEYVPSGRELAAGRD